MTFLMKNRINFSTLLLLGLVTFHQNSLAETLDRIVAVVDNDIITQVELERELDLIKKELRAQRTMMPPENILRRQVLEREIINRIQQQYANNTGILINDTELNSILDRIAEQNNLSLNQLRKKLEADGYEFAQFREQLRKNQIIMALQNREVMSRVNITEQEITNFLNSQALQGNADTEFNLLHIMIALPEAANAKEIDTAKQKARETLNKLKKGADFKQTAISVSEGQQALKGGDMGWRTTGQMPSIFAAEVLHMKKGELSTILRSPGGFHILKLADKRAGQPQLVRQTKARHILIRTDNIRSENEVVARLKQLRQRIQSGESFENIAKTQSEDYGSGAQGGDLGWVSPGQMVRPFEEAMNKLAIKEISQPIKTQFGWHILQVLDRRQQDQSEEITRNRAIEFLRQRKAEEMREAWLRQIRDEAYVEYKVEI